MLIFLHGHADYSQSWRNWMDALKQDYQVYALDLPGYRQADANRFDQASLEQILSELWERINQIHAGKITLVGHDVGAFLAFRLADRYPKRVEQVISFNLSHPQNYFAWYEKNPPEYIDLYLKRDNFGALELQQLYQWKSSQPDFLNYLKAMQEASPRAMLNYYHQIFSSSSRSYSWSHPTKCLAISGTHDSAVPPAAFDQSQCDLITINAGSHDLHLSVNPLLYSAIRHWLQGQSHFKHFHVIDQNLQKSYIAKFAPDGAIYAMGDPLVKFSAKHYLQKEIVRDGLNLIDFLITQDNHLLLASDFTAPKNNNGIGRLFEFKQTSIQEIARIPNLHRMVWLDNNKTQFVAAAIFSKEEASPTFNTTHPQLFHFTKKKIQWQKNVIPNTLRLLHGVKADAQDSSLFYTASWEGIHRWRQLKSQWTPELVYPGEVQNDFHGSSEVLAIDDLIATIGPWHGDRLSILKQGKVVQSYQQHQQGHGLAKLDVNGDGVGDIVSCFMGQSAGVFWYDSKAQNVPEYPILSDFKCQGITSDKRSLLITGESHLIKIDF